MNGTRDTWTRRIIIGGCALILGIVLAACGSSKGSASGAESSARGAIASATANPATAAQLRQAKALVKSCIPASPLDQAQMVHLVFLSSATGKHGPEVVAARTKLGTCLGISKADEKPFFNEAVIAAEHGHLVRGGHAARVQYFGVTLPGLVIKYSNAASFSPSPGTSGGVPATMPASTKSGASS
jgi:hypothetical protein